MSAVAIPFDPTFTLGPRSNFTWPGSLDSTHASESMLSHEPRSMGSSVLEASPTPSSGARSLTGSPPILASYMHDHRDLKRQHDRARRDSKLSARMRRAHSNTPCYDSPPPMSLHEVSTGPMDIPHYSAAPSSLPMLAEHPSSLSSSGYMHSYSPPLPEHQPAAPMFPTPYQQHLPSSYSMSMEYPGQYTTHSSPFPNRSSPTLPVAPEPGMMYQMPSVVPQGTVSSDNGHVRVVQSRPKPRCWEHGCNGRQFSTFSNLLRHQREKSGQATKASCPNCGAEFTRTTARNGHLLHDKCKQRRNS